MLVRLFGGSILQTQHQPDLLKLIINLCVHQMQDVVSRKYLQLISLLVVYEI